MMGNIHQRTQRNTSNRSSAKPCRIEKISCAMRTARVSSAPFVAYATRHPASPSMTQRLHIANAYALRPFGRGKATLAPAHRPACGDRKELLAITC